MGLGPEMGPPLELPDHLNGRTASWIPVIIVMYCVGGVDARLQNL